MDQAAADPDRYYSREEYYAWCETRTRGRFERVDGRIVAMAPERLRHVRVKTAVLFEFRRAIAAAGIDCEAIGDGIAIQVDDNDYEPDVTVSCGPIDDDTLWPPNPVILVEVLSPGTASVDTGMKLVDYFRLPSVLHYLVVHPSRRTVIHHRRTGHGIAASIVPHGTIDLEPPGITVNTEAFY